MYTYTYIFIYTFKYMSIHMCLYIYCVCCVSALRTIGFWIGSAALGGACVCVCSRARFCANLKDRVKLVVCVFVCVCLGV